MTIKFYKSNEPYGFLNNYTIAPMYIFDRYWQTVEAAYQAQKTNDPQEYLAIAEAQTPKEARNLGQKVKIRDDWELMKYGVMYFSVLAKFEQNEDLKQKLLETGDEEIIEDSKIDWFWGCGADGKGQNMLGKILMEVRNKIRNK